IDLGGLNHFTPYVLGPAGVPEVVDEAQAFANPELVAFSAIAHGHDENAELSAEIASLALRVAATLDSDRSKIYCDQILKSLSEAALAALGEMDARKYEYQSDFARQYIAQGRTEGEVQGRAAFLLRLLMSRFGPLDSEVEARIWHASIVELETIG